VAPCSSIYETLHWYRHRTIYYIRTDSRAHRLARGNIHHKAIGAHRWCFMYRPNRTCHEVSANASSEAPICTNVYTDLYVTLDAGVFFGLLCLWALPFWFSSCTSRCVIVVTIFFACCSKPKPTGAYRRYTLQTLFSAVHKEAFPYKWNFRGSDVHERAVRSVCHPWCLRFLFLCWLT